MTRLSKHFTLEELCRSQTATRIGIENKPNAEAIEALETLALHVLEPIREVFGAFTPTSGFRSESLNTIIGGASRSQHMLGQAADMKIPNVSTHDLAVFIRDQLDIDQLILEYYDPKEPYSGWVHVSYVGENNRNKTLTIDRLTVTDGIAGE